MKQQLCIEGKQLSHQVYLEQNLLHTSVQEADSLSLRLHFFLNKANTNHALGCTIGLLLTGFNLLWSCRNGLSILCTFDVFSNSNRFRIVLFKGFVLMEASRSPLLSFHAASVWSTALQWLLG